MNARRLEEEADMARGVSACGRRVKTGTSSAPDGDELLLRGSGRHALLRGSGRQAAHGTSNRMVACVGAVTPNLVVTREKYVILHSI